MDILNAAMLEEKLKGTTAIASPTPAFHKILN
jgi:hypothetical protein